MGMSFLWESHGKRPMLWDGTGINCYGMGMGQINMSHGQPWSFCITELCFWSNLERYSEKMVGCLPLWNTNLPISSSYMYFIDIILEGGLVLQFDDDLNSMIFNIFWCICFGGFTAVSPALPQLIMHWWILQKHKICGFNVKDIKIHWMCFIYTWTVVVCFWKQTNPVAMRGFHGLNSPNKGSSPPSWNMGCYRSVELL